MISNRDETRAQRGSDALGDDPSGNETPAWQQSIVRWQWLIGFGPFVLVLLFARTRASDSLPHWMLLPLMLLPVLWAVAFNGYLLYLRYQK